MVKRDKKGHGLGSPHQHAASLFLKGAVMTMDANTPDPMAKEIILQFYQMCKMLTQAEVGTTITHFRVKAARKDE